jgi:hypothetical protein
MDKPIDTAALDALLAETHEATRKLAEAVRESCEVQAQSLALLQWWRFQSEHLVRPRDPGGRAP